MAGKRGRQATRSGAGGWPGWVWLCLGVLLGMILSAIVLIGDWAPTLRGGHTEPSPNPQATAPKASEPGVADEGSNPPGDKEGKDYDFYSVLPEMEVVIPDAELSAKAAHESDSSQASASATGGATRYLLQAGSFPDGKDAEAVKAKLALLGFVADIQPVTINGQTWHRVRVGPYTSARDLEAAKQKLAGNGINAIALKETGK